MTLPVIVEQLLSAQSAQNSAAYADCFSDSGIVTDEGKTHKGRKEIQEWNANTNGLYQFTIEPVDFTQEENAGLLKAKTSGNFPGSPIILNYNFRFSNGLIEELNISG